MNLVLVELPSTLQETQRYMKRTDTGRPSCQMAEAYVAADKEDFWDERKAWH